MTFSTATGAVTIAITGTITAITMDRAILPAGSGHLLPCLVIATTLNGSRNSADHFAWTACKGGLPQSRNDFGVCAFLTHGNTGE